MTASTTLAGIVVDPSSKALDDNRLFSCIPGRSLPTTKMTFWNVTKIQLSRVEVHLPTYNRELKDIYLPSSNREPKDICRRRTGR
jgi:hypothetical protein